MSALPAFFRHVALVFVGAVLTVLSGVPVIGWDAGLAKTALAAGIGAVVTLLLAVITPLTRQYGVGSGKAPAVTDSAQASTGKVYRP